MEKFYKLLLATDILASFDMPDIATDFEDRQDTGLCKLIGVWDGSGPHTANSCIDIRIYQDAR